MCVIRLPPKNRSDFWARCPSTLTLFRKCICVLRSFFNADVIIVSSISKSGTSIRSSIDRDILSSSIDFVIWTSLIQCIMIWGSSVLGQNLSPEVGFPALKFHRVRKFAKIQFRDRNSRIIHHNFMRKKFHQYDSTCHFYFGSGMKESTYSTILFSFHSLFSLLLRQCQTSIPERRGCHVEYCRG